MNNRPPSLTSPEPRPQASRTSFKPVLITIAVAFVLLLSSVFSVFATCGSFDSRPSPLFHFFTYCVYFSLAVFALTLAWLLLSLFIWLIQKLR